MKKLVNVLVNVITLITLIVGVVSAIYLALPLELQEKIPLNIREVILLLIANGGLGGFLAFIKFLETMIKGKMKTKTLKSLA